MTATILLLDLFDNIDFWTSDIEIDLVYNVVGIISQSASQDLTIRTIAIDLFDQILSKGMKRLCFLANGVPASLVALQLASLLRGRDDMELCKLCLLGGSFVPPSRGLLMQSLYNLKYPRDSLVLFLSPEFLSSKSSSQVKENVTRSISRDQLVEYGGLDQIASAIQEFSMPPEEIKLLTSIPLLLLHGEKDKMVDLSYSLALHEQWSKSEIHILPGAGHWIHIEAAPKVASLINNWLHVKKSTTQNDA